MMDERQVVKEAFEEVLRPDDPDAQVEVESGSADYWHVIAVSRSFEGQPMTQRNKVTHQTLRKLAATLGGTRGATLALRITVVMLLTPEEYEEVLEGRRIFADA